MIRDAGKNLFYVYCLKNSLSGEIFYVGKGKGGRLHTHLIDFKNGNDTNPAKTFEISSILKSGGTIIAEKLQDNLTEGRAYDIELAWIEKLGLKNLTNISPGRMSVIERTKQQARNLLAKVIPFKDWLNQEAQTPYAIEMYRRVVAELRKISREGDISSQWLS
jgi:hypothetical protein